MDMLPNILPDKLPLERVAVYLQLGPVIGNDIIDGTPVFASDPAGLVFSSPMSIDAGQTAVALVDGGVAGTVYVLSAYCELTSGQAVQPVVALPVVEPVAETINRRTVTI